MVDGSDAEFHTEEVTVDQFIRVPLQFPGFSRSELRLLCQGCSCGGKGVVFSKNGLVVSVPDESAGGYVLISEAAAKADGLGFTDFPVEPLRKYEIEIRTLSASLRWECSVICSSVTGKTQVTTVPGNRDLTRFAFETRACDVFVRLSFRLFGEGVWVVREIKVIPSADPARSAIEPLKWSIRCPADWLQRDLWGDYHVAQNLASELRALGQSVRVDCHEDWDQASASDVNLVIRGKHRFQIADTRCLNLLWLLSHPDTVSEEETVAYDQVLIASIPEWRQRRRRLGSRCLPWLQATALNPKVGSPLTERQRTILFVGNGRLRPRPMIDWIRQARLPLQLIGPGWAPCSDGSCEVMDSIANEQLGGVYSSYFCTLNDHWESMRARGFVNNRTLDALAALSPVVSDEGPGFRDLFSDEVLYFNTRSECIEHLARIAIDARRLEDTIRQRQLYLHSNFHFSRRALEILQLVRELRSGFQRCDEPHPVPASG